jgi:hypothetical protein
MANIVSKNIENEGGVHAGMITGANGGSPIQVAAETRENGDNRGRSNATGIETQSKMMECKAVMRRKVTSKSAL